MISKSSKDQILKPICIVWLLRWKANGFDGGDGGVGGGGRGGGGDLKI